MATRVNLRRIWTTFFKNIKMWSTRVNLRKKRIFCCVFCVFCHNFFKNIKMWSTRVNLRKKTQFLLRFLRIFHARETA